MPFYFIFAAAAPSFAVAGSYFPAWIVFAFIAVILTVLIRVVFIRLGIDDVMRFKVFVYTALAMGLCFAALWVFFGVQ